jgi:hypothetical protein
VKPAIRIIFAPIFKRDKEVRERGLYLHGKATGRTVTLDPRGAETLLDTMVHEIAHCNHPDWSEQAVREYTKRRLSKMSWKEKARMLKLLGNAIIEGEE